MSKIFQYIHLQFGKAQLKLDCQPTENCTKLINITRLTCLLDHSFTII